MTRYVLVPAVALAALITLAACDTAPPYSNVVDTTGRGVGFSDYAQYMRAQEELSRIRRQQAAQGQVAGRAGPQFAPQQQSTQQAAAGGAIGAEAVAAVRGQPVQPTPVQQQPSGQFQTADAAPQQQAPASSSAGVSDQQFTPQPFGTPQQNRVVTRDHVPQVRVSQDEIGTGDGPNLFVYALSTRHNVGEQRYTRRHPLRWQRWEAACSQFATQDLAQDAFLMAGGPERDPNHLDPDGDGFACWWDPTPFRQAATTVRARQ
ncbi:hypothetical protein [Roseinatronobacter alkalisoli]|uniref:Excalibur calcium-binding domain-containing protein n=1 Tax=Roseinatronobacter alkalisoli TaxID=3028235 RepID=A0ABT5T9H0_9RHOB|nr:hypothetical protein [Roseinatronobacter sp. HJB301]MDD7971724.1 hypothetical protein [Roseinatronobacter sp. HJB301]